MATIPIPSIDTVDTCELGVRIDTSTKYRLFSILLCLWLIACMRRKAKKCEFFSGGCLMELDQGKIINCVPDRIFHSNPHFGKDNVSQRKYAICLKLTGVGIEIWYRYH